MEYFQFNTEKKTGNSIFEFCPSDLSGLLNEFESKKLLVAGEMHGVKQNYDIYKFLVQELGVESVGMEIPEEEFNFLLNLDKQSINNPLVRLKLKTNAYKDGRFSDSLLDFILFLKRTNVNIFLFDNGKHDFDKSQEDNAVLRDKAMANDILKNFKVKKTLIIAGNYHTKTNRKGSMASFINQKTKFTNVNIQYLSGSYYNFGEKNFTEFIPLTTDCIRFRKSEDNSDFNFQIPIANKVSVF